MQAEHDRRDCQRQRHRELQVEERIMHRGHDVRTDAEAEKEDRKRNRRCREQRKRQHQADRPGAVIVRGERSNELIGFHDHGSPSLAVRLASPRCSATRTAPSLIENFAAVSLIDAASTAIDCSTSRWRCGSEASLAATSPAGAVSAAGSLAIVSAKSSILTKI